MMTRRCIDRLGRDRLCSIGGRLRIAGRLLYAARCRLRLRGRLRGLLARRVSARRRRIGTIRRVGGALFRSRLVRGTSREQRKGEYSPGETDYR
jgi:hypothetical protein